LVTQFLTIIEMPASSCPSRKHNNDSEGNPSSPSSAHVTSSKKKKAASPAVAHAPAPVVAPVLEPALKKKAATPTAVAAHAPVVAPVLEPALKKKAAAPTMAAAPAPVVATDSAATPPVVDSLSKKNKPSGIVTVADRAPVVSVSPSVETAPKKQADVANTVNACNDEELVESSEEDSEEDAGNADDYSQDDLEEESEESEEEEYMDQRSDQQSEEDKGTKHEGVDDVIAVQGGITHGNMGQSAGSFSCILFSIPDIVM
jgi:hypothetical protein